MEKSGSIKIIEIFEKSHTEKTSFLWHDSVSDFFNTEFSRDLFEDERESSITAYHFSTFLLCHSYIRSGKLIRLDDQIKRDDLDHYIVHLVLDGLVYFSLDSRSIQLRPMDIGILDLSRSARLGFREAEAVSLILPRAEFDLPQRLQIPRHGRRLSRFSPAGMVLARHLIALAEEAPRLDGNQALLLARATLDLLLTCLSISPFADPDPPAAGLDPAVRVRSYIERNLQRSGLSPAEIARDLGLSRSQLYRQFERFGGVGSYIRRRRLKRSFAEICNPWMSHRRIGDIAFSLGFEDEAHFSRVFRQAFGLSPRAARAASIERRAQSAPPARPAGESSFADWMADLALS